MVATRARWRVESKSSEKTLEPDNDENDGAGEIGNTVAGGINTGKVAVVSEEEEEEEETESPDAGGEGDAFDTGRPVGRPWAARALSTASQPFSRVLILSRSSSFSFFSRFLSSALSSSDLRSSDMPIVSRSCLFSSSSSATRCSR